jgi:hypothetical protein
MHINHTTYDVCWDEDVIHMRNNAQCNIMVLAPESPNVGSSKSGPEVQHLFWYAHVLGIYHANVVYLGEGNSDYLPCQLEFLWVWWYDVRSQNSDWSVSQGLDCLSLLPLNDEHAFGFLDPGDVLQASHIIPVFREGSACENGPGLSCCAQGHDHSDWKSYVVNRWVQLS